MSFTVLRTVNDIFRYLFAVRTVNITTQLNLALTFRLGVSSVNVKGRHGGGRFSPTLQPNEYHSTLTSANI